MRQGCPAHEYEDTNRVSHQILNSNKSDKLLIGDLPYVKKSILFL